MKMFWGEITEKDKCLIRLSVDFDATICDIKPICEIKICSDNDITLNKGTYDWDSIKDIFHINNLKVFLDGNYIMYTNFDGVAMSTCNTIISGYGRPELIDEILLKISKKYGNFPIEAEWFDEDDHYHEAHVIYYNGERYDYWSNEDVRKTVQYTHNKYNRYCLENFYDFEDTL